MSQRTNAQKTAIALLVVGNRLSGECDSFLAFARESGLFNKIGIDFAGIVAWDELEFIVINEQLDEYCNNLMQHKNIGPNRNITFGEMMNKAKHLKKHDDTYWDNLIKDWLFLKPLPACPNRFNRLELWRLRRSGCNWGVATSLSQAFLYER